MPTHFPFRSICSLAFASVFPAHSAAAADPPDSLDAYNGNWTSQSKNSAESMPCQTRDPHAIGNRSHSIIHPAGIFGCRDIGLTRISAWAQDSPIACCLSRTHPPTNTPYETDIADIIPTRAGLPGTTRCGGRIHGYDVG